MSIGMATRGIICGNTTSSGVITVTETVFVSHGVSPESESINKVPIINVLDTNATIVPPETQGGVALPSRRTQTEVLPSSGGEYVLPE